MPQDVLFDGTSFDRATGKTDDWLPLYRSTLQQADGVLAQRFARGDPIAQLVHGRSWVIDQLLTRIWPGLMGTRAAQLALVAVGGYGRGELHPHSDVDLLILLPEDPRPEVADELERFLLFLWDMGLEVGHSARTVTDCVQTGRADITVATNLMESRLLAGDASLYYAMSQATGPDRIWPVRDFFAAKWQEQIARHHKFHDTAYNLEPNVKEGPGGLRDIQMIGWVAQRHFDSQRLDELVDHGFLTAAEYRALIDGQNFLWRVRFGLHLLARRRENRLLFDHQRTLAEQFGYRDENNNLAVEQFMKRYYRTVMELGQLNEMLLQLFQEKILPGEAPIQITPLGDYFQSRNGYLEVRHDLVFIQHPQCLLEIFLLLAQRPQLKGIRAETIRLIRSHLHLIDDAFRASDESRTLFMTLLRQPQGIYTALRQMNQHGVLGAYLPVFGRIVGQLQHDLFHVYTVDEHTLFVLRNIRRYGKPPFHDEFPLCRKVMEKIERPEVLYIAALFHDIAKGRGGDHSELGADEVQIFCQEHALADTDTRLAVWLVRNHLLMSSTAQRQDISVPEVINAFAARMGDERHLDHLYLLTVADIRATSPTLWNSWKDSLLGTLYNRTHYALRRGLTNPIDASEHIMETKQAAQTLLREQAIDEQAINALWARLGDDYFLRYTTDTIAWHSAAIIQAQQHGASLPLIALRRKDRQGGTELFFYTLRHDNLFALTTRTLDKLALTITDARIMATRDGHTLDTYIVLEEDGSPLRDADRMHELENTLHKLLSHPDTLPRKVKRRLPRRLQHFSLPTEVSFEPDPYNNRTIMEVISSDRPGLLSQIGKAMMECKVRLQNAKIATFGARAEDIFFITDAANHPLTDSQQMDCLRQRIIELLAQ